MELKIEKTVKHNVVMSKDGVGIHIEIDQITIASFSTKGHLRVYLDGLNKLGMEMDVFGKADGINRCLWESRQD